MAPHHRSHDRLWITVMFLGGTMPSRVKLFLIAITRYHAEKERTLTLENNFQSFFRLWAVTFVLHLNLNELLRVASDCGHYNVINYIRTVMFTVTSAYNITQPVRAKGFYWSHQKHDFGPFLCNTTMCEEYVLGKWHNSDIYRILICIKICFITKCNGC